MTRKEVKQLPQEQPNDDFVSVGLNLLILTMIQADEYREVINQMQNEQQTEQNSRVSISFIEGGTLKINKSIYNKIQDKLNFSKLLKQANRHHNSEKKSNMMGSLFKNMGTFRHFSQDDGGVTPRSPKFRQSTTIRNFPGFTINTQRISAIERETPKRDSRDQFLKIANQKYKNSSMPQSHNSSIIEISQPPPSSSVFITSGIAQIHPSLKNMPTIRLMKNQDVEVQSATLRSHSSATTPLLRSHSNALLKQRTSIPSYLLPGAKESVRQKVMVEGIIKKCKRLQEKEAIQSQIIKQAARNIDQGVNTDFNNLKKKISIMLHINKDNNVMKTQKDEQYQ